MATTGPCMVLALDREGAIVVQSDGVPAWFSYSELSFDWRYDHHRGAWVDVGPYEENDGYEEEEADDGSEEIS